MVATLLPVDLNLLYPDMHIYHVDCVNSLDRPYHLTYWYYKAEYQESEVD